MRLFDERMDQGTLGRTDLMLVWADPGGTTHGIKDFAGLFIETWCGMKLSKTKAALHEEYPGASPMCAACDAKEPS